MAIGWNSKGTERPVFSAAQSRQPDTQPATFAPLTLVVLISEAAVGGYVHHQSHTARKVTQLALLAINVGGILVVEGRKRR